MKYGISKKVMMILRWLLTANIVMLLLLFVHFFFTIFICDSFIIPSESMAPSLMPGDRVWVNKMLFGARIYTSFDYDNHSPLRCFRVPGIRKIVPGDIICFNYPHGYDDLDKIEFKINNVYCKRVLGTPGDRIGAVDGHYWNDKVLRPIGLVNAQNNLRWMYDSLFIWGKCFDVIPLSLPKWNIKNWGPIVVPAKGQTIAFDDFTWELYKSIVEFETGDTHLLKMKQYTFEHDYYFAVGDNVISSNDSRYWGFIPDDYIIGIVCNVIRN